MRTYNKIGIAGAGIMGIGIAQVFANSGFKVVLFNLRTETLEKAKKSIRFNQDNLFREGFIDESTYNKSFDLIQLSINKNDLTDVDLLLETIVEKLEIKQLFWEEFSRLVKKDTILASNTSGLSITSISKNIERKDRFAGMHWWNPPHILHLVEVARGEYTSDDTINELVELTRVLGKKPVVVKKDVPGFLGNRLQFAIFREALNLVEQGVASIEDVDTALKYGPGMRFPVLGTLQAADLGGLDTFYNISTYMFKELSSMTEPPQVLSEKIKNGELGTKTGSGFYDYSNGKGEELLRKRDEKFLKMLKDIM